MNANKKIDSEKDIQKDITDLMVLKVKLIEDGAKKVLEENREEKGIRGLIDLCMYAYEEHKRVFFMGEGRSKLVGEGCAMRFRQMDFHAHVIGESTAPRVREEDIVMVISGSGTTSTNIDRCEKIITEIGAKIIVITSHRDSPLGRLADVTIKLPGREEVVEAVDYSRKRLVGGPILPLRTFFEAIAGIFLDSIIEKLMYLTKTSEEKMEERHAI
ncbi:MAG: SIS domain-containing protein [Candidatus Nealsonbacteria bacterium]|nr:MAG: SIS domain-containing protein [Candidatus Nealsonbacteria bacterium]